LSLALLYKNKFKNFKEENIMAFDLNNFVIDRIVRGIATAQRANADLGIAKDDVLFSINQITNPSLNCTSESADAVDALSVPIATFYRAKQCEFSAENALFDMNLMATQVGATKKVAGVGNATVVTPLWVTIDTNSTGSYDLGHTLTADQASAAKAYVLKGDGTLADKLTVGTAAARTSVTISGKTVTYIYDETGATGFKAGEQIFIMAEYIADGSENNGAVEVTNSATKFPVGCKFIMEILGADVCDQTNLIYAYLIFPNAKLSPDFDWSIATDSTHPFSMRAMQELTYIAPLQCKLL
jgi:hypothetical protein